MNGCEGCTWTRASREVQVVRRGVRGVDGCEGRTWTRASREVYRAIRKKWMSVNGCNWVWMGVKAAPGGAPAERCTCLQRC